MPRRGEETPPHGIIKVYHNERLALRGRGSRGNELFCTSRANSPRPTFRKTGPGAARDAHAQFTCTGGGLMSVEDTRGGPLAPSGQRRAACPQRATYPPWSIPTGIVSKRSVTYDSRSIRSPVCRLIGIALLSNGYWVSLSRLLIF